MRVLHYLMGTLENTGRSNEAFLSLVIQEQ